MAHIRIAHLYPKRMNIYGDQGNVVALAKRCQWRDIAVSLHEFEIGDHYQAGDYDLFFFGGGQDEEQGNVAKDLKQKSKDLKQAVANGAAMLAVCGGYQLLGRYYQPLAGKRLEGIGIFDAWTEAGPDRLIGNVVAKPAIDGISDRPLVGFENHSGLTFLGNNAKPLATVVSGNGNNPADDTEGCVSGHAIGTYLHGSLLPKNPHLADWLISRALKKRYPGLALGELEDTFELITNEKVAARFS